MTSTLTPISTMTLVDFFYNYSLWFALLAIVLIIVGLVVLASGNSVGWVPLLCGLVSGGALWGIVRPRVRVRDAQNVRRTDKERAPGMSSNQAALRGDRPFRGTEGGGSGQGGDVVVLQVVLVPVEILRGNRGLRRWR
jgi:hypothetical protein